MFHDREFSVSILTWGGSLIVHGLLILGMLTFLTQVTPPASKASQWKVALVTPTPSPELSEHAKTVKPSPQPTTRSTVSRPQPKRHLPVQRRIQQRQPSTQKTAVVTRPIPQVMKSIESPQSLPTQVAETITTISSQRTNRQTVVPQKTSPPSRSVPHTQSSPRTVRSQVTQALRTTQHKVATPSKKPIQAREQEEPTKLAPHVRTPQTTAAKAMQTHNTQARPQAQVVTRSLARHQTASTKQRRHRQPQQPAIYAGAPERQPMKKLRHRSKPASITRAVAKSRPKASSEKTMKSNQLSAEALAFLKLLREKIERHRQYPRMAKRLGYQGTTTVSFALSHEGDLMLLKVASPSGHSVLDEAALAAIQDIAPLKPPTTIGGTPIEIPVSFELSR